MREDLKKPLLEIVRLIGITLAVYLVVRFLLPLALPFLVAFFLAKQLHPLVEKLHKKIKLKKGIVSAAVLVVFLALAVAVLWFVGKNLFAQLGHLIENLPEYQDKAVVLWNDCCEQVEDWTGMKDHTLNGRIEAMLPKIWNNLKGTMLPGLMSSSFSWAKGIFLFTGVCIIVGISTLLILKDYPAIVEGMGKGTLGKSFLGLSRRVYRAGGSYIRAQLIIMIIVSIICVLGLFFAGSEFAMAAGLGIGVCDALPFLGTGTIFVPWALLELLQGKYMAAVVYIIIYTVCSLVRELLEPKLVGDRLGIPPLTVVISIYVGLCIYGLWGFALGPLSYLLIKEVWLELKGG